MFRRAVLARATDYILAQRRKERKGKTKGSTWRNPCVTSFCASKQFIAVRTQRLPSLARCRLRASSHGVVIRYKNLIYAGAKHDSQGELAGAWKTVSMYSIRQFHALIHRAKALREQQK